MDYFATCKSEFPANFQYICKYVDQRDVYNKLAMTKMRAMLPLVLPTKYWSKVGCSQVESDSGSKEYAIPISSSNVNLCLTNVPKPLGYGVFNESNLKNFEPGCVLTTGQMDYLIQYV